MTNSIQEILEDYVLGEIFCEFPTDLQGAFQFFMEADVDCAVSVAMSPLGEEWGYEVCEAYELENIRSLRGLMQNMYNDLERLKSSLFQYAVKPVNVSLDDFDDENKFYEFIQKSNSILHSQGAANEHATILTVDVEAIS